MRCAPALIAQPMSTKTGDITPPLFQLCYEILAEMEYVGHLSLIAINLEKHEILMLVKILSLQSSLDQRLVLWLFDAARYCGQFAYRSEKVTIYTIRRLRVFQLVLYIRKMPPHLLFWLPARRSRCTSSSYKSEFGSQFRAYFLQWLSFSAISFRKPAINTCQHLFSRQRFI